MDGHGDYNGLPLVYWPSRTDCRGRSPCLPSQRGRHGDLPLPRRICVDKLPILPTTVVGSHGKSGWWYEAVKAWEAGRWGPYDLDEMMDDAADTAIRDMTRAGIDVITDGEVRRLDGYVDSYYAVIKGIEPVEQARHAGPWGYDQQT